MRKVIPGILLLAVLSIPFIGSGEGTVQSLPGDSDAGALRDVCAWQDEMVVLGANGVWTWNPATGEMQSLLKFSIDLLQNPIETNYRQLNHLFVQDDRLYVYDSFSLTFYQVENHQLARCFENLQDVLSGGEAEEDSRWEYVSDVSSNGLYLLLQTESDSGEKEEPELFYLDGTTGSISGLGPVAVDMLYGVANQALLAGNTDEDARTLYLVYPDSGYLTPLNDTIYSTESAGFVLTEEQTLYFAEKGRLIKEKDGVQSMTVSLPYQYIYPSSKAFLLGNTYALLQDSALTVRDTNGNHDNEISLRVLGNISDQIVQSYCFNHPEISISFDARADQLQGLQSALVSSDSNIDLFVVSSDDIYHDVLEKRFAAPLSNSEKLVHRVNSFYPWAKDILFKDGNLYSIPISILTDYWTVNRSKWQEMELGDYPLTFHELFQVAERWREEFSDQYPDYYLFESMGGVDGMIESVVHQYLLEHESWEQPVNFDTAEFRTIIQSILDHEDLFIEHYMQTPLMMSYAQYLGTGYNDEDLVESILPPALTQDAMQVARGSLELLVLNPRSAHQEEAIQFMEYYLEHLDAMTVYQIDASKNTPLRQDGYEAAVQTMREQMEYLQKWLDGVTDDEKMSEIQSQLDSLQKRMEMQEGLWRFSAEDIAIYQEIAEHIIIPAHTIYPQQGAGTEILNDVIARFTSGTMSMDQFVKNMNDKAKIMFMEDMN